MSRTVFCEKLKKEAKGFDLPPYPGVLGERIYQTISVEAWKQWQQRQIMYINEYRLSLLDPDAHALLEKEMEKFLFSEDSVLPPGAGSTN
ncbi:MAG: oxidative damage protection protein [Gammaproteobacteria bacterium]|nr:oxidative damage protection protein [Gammaproteobacteria bacterium]